MQSAGPSPGYLGACRFQCWCCLPGDREDAAGRGPDEESLVDLWRFEFCADLDIYIFLQVHAEELHGNAGLSQLPRVHRLRGVADTAQARSAFVGDFKSSAGAVHARSHGGTHPFPVVCVGRTVSTAFEIVRRRAHPVYRL